MNRKRCLSFDVTQNQIQRIVDGNTRRIVQEGCSSIRDRARLNAILTPHSDSWLWEIHNSHLSLVMSRQEFVSALRLRLGMSVSSPPPSSVTCPCRQVLDRFGDHAFGCGSGPLGIKCHDALCNILFQNLLVDNAGTRREQRCCK